MTAKKKTARTKKEPTIQEELAKVRREFETMRSMIFKSTKALDALVKDTVTKIAQYGEDLASVKKTNESAEETLMNVLCAIRQNEYLQAWAPAQHGFPAMNIVGTHPAKLMARSEKEA